MNDQILDEVNKDIVTKVEAMGKVKYEINNDVNRIKQDWRGQYNEWKSQKWYQGWLANLRDAICDEVKCELDTEELEKKMGDTIEESITSLKTDMENFQFEHWS